MATSVQQAFREFQSRLELTEAHQTIISTHHNAVRDWIEAYDPAIDTKLVGSLQRKTRIRPRPEKDPFDIDVLVVLETFVQWVPWGGVPPETALDRVEDIVSASETYDRMGPETDNPTIVLPYADGTRVELIPAYHDEIGLFPDGTPVPPVGRGFWIPKSAGLPLARSLPGQRVETPTLPACRTDRCSLRLSPPLSARERVGARERLRANE